MAQLKDSLVQGSMRVTDTLYANALNTVKIDTSGDITLISASGNSPSLIFDRGSTLTDWRLIVASGKLSFQSRTGANAFTERGSFGDNNGAFSAATFNGLTLTAASTGFTIAGGTTSKTLTVSDTVTLKTGSATYLTYYSAVGTIAGHSLAHFSDEFGSNVANKKNELVLGNATAKATNGSAWGQIALYSPGTKGTYLNSAENSTAWYTATLQAKTGTIALTSDITATAVGLGNVENTKLSTWTGSSNIATVGTITSGTWNGSAVPVANGGTGATTAANARTNLGLGSAATYNITGGNEGYSSSATLIPRIGTDGVMEVGKYIDFHAATGTSKNYDVRITAATTGLTISGTTSGTFSGSLTGNASSATKIAAKLAATTKTYLLGTSTTITGTAANVELIGDTGVYLTTTSGELSAVKYSINSSGTEKINLQYDTTTDILNFVFV